MEISYAFFAEAAQITSDGRVNILGADLAVVRFPGTPPWTSGAIAMLVSIYFDREECGRLYHLSADLIAPDGNAIEPHIEQAFVAPVLEQADTVGRMNVVLQMFGLHFSGAGVYHM